MPLSTPQLVDLLAEGIPVRQRALSWYGAVLTARANTGHVSRAGRTPGGYQRGPAQTWSITGAGRAWLADRDAAPARAAARKAEAARRSELADRDAAARTEKLRQVRAAYRTPPPRDAWLEVAREMRTASCTCAEIGSVLGVTRQTAHHLLREGDAAQRPVLEAAR